MSRRRRRLPPTHFTTMPRELQTRLGSRRAQDVLHFVPDRRGLFSIAGKGERKLAVGLRKDGKGECPRGRFSEERRGCAVFLAGVGGVKDCWVREGNFKRKRSSVNYFSFLFIVEINFMFNFLLILYAYWKMWRFQCWIIRFSNYGLGLLKSDYRRFINF